MDVPRLAIRTWEMHWEWAAQPGGEGRRGGGQARRTLIGSGGRHDLDGLSRIKSPPIEDANANVGTRLPQILQ